MDRRNTIQKELIHSTVLDMRRHVTAEEVFESIKVNHPSIGKGTVYRNLSILADEGKIRRVEIPNGPDRFDFTLDNHYHIRCIGCGDVQDVDIEVINGLEDKIHNKHGMKIINYDILFKGICQACQSKTMKKSE